MSGKERASWRPTREEELLLQAALLEGEDALHAWEQWRSSDPSPEDEVLAFQVLPLAYWNIRELDPEADGLQVAKGVYRYVWVKNQVLRSFGGRMIGRLSEAGIPSLVLKGMALAVLYYRNPGLRLMADIDLLVPRDRALEAIAALRGSLEPGPAPLAPEDRIAVEHGCEWVDGSGNAIDLHWYSLWQSAPDDDFWEGAVPIDIDGVPSATLCPADQLLHICAHGALWHRPPVLRWVADAVTVMRAEPALDWDRLLAGARRRELSRTIGDALDYLAERMGARVPAEVIAGLRRTRTSWSERAARRGLSRPPTPPGVLAAHWDRYRRVRRLDPGAPSPSSFPAHLRTAWGYTSYGGFAGHLISRLRSPRGLPGTHGGRPRHDAPR